LPPDAFFTHNFLGNLRNICQRYKEDTTSDLDQIPTSRGQAYEADRSSPVPPVNLTKFMRKTQQHGPFVQLYDALGTTLPDAPPSLQAAVGNSLSPPGLHDTIEQPDDDDGIDWDHLLSTATTKPQTSAAWMSKVRYVWQVSYLRITH
jgi:hypothetical protein